VVTQQVSGFSKQPIMATNVYQHNILSLYICYVILSTLILCSKFRIYLLVRSLKIRSTICS